MGTAALPTAGSSTSHDLGITVTDRGGAAIVCLSGRLSIDSSPALRERLLALLKQQSPPMLTIDLSDWPISTAPALRR